MNTAIVGGGVAGLTTALRLLQDGHRVTLFEKQRKNIDKVCGEGLLPFGVGMLDELDLRESFREIGHSFHGLAYHVGEREVAGTFPGGQFGLGLERGLLDQLLRKRCEAFDGFQLQTGVKVSPQTLTGYRRVLVADGVHSQWSQALGKTRRFGRRLGLRFRLDLPAGQTAPRRVRVYFYPDYEIYLTPTAANVLSVAFLIDADRLKQPGSALRPWALAKFRKAFPEFAQLPVRDLATRGPIVAHTPVPPRDVHLIGDAYRTFDPISGAGMSFALLCGKLAAEHLNDPAAYYRALRPYVRCIDDITNAVLFFRGGGLKSHLMVRQLGKAPQTFERILGMHDARHRFFDLGLGGMLSFLRV